MKIKIEFKKLIALCIEAFLGMERGFDEKYKGFSYLCELLKITNLILKDNIYIKTNIFINKIFYFLLTIIKI